MRHGPTGGRIAVTVTADGHSAVAEVVDEGPGIAPEDRARLFERFERGRRAVPGEGFGVGLSLARWIVECHDGEMTINSPAIPPLGPDPAGPGTRATIRLPVAASCGGDA